MILSYLFSELFYYSKDFYSRFKIYWLICRKILFPKLQSSLEGKRYFLKAGVHERNTTLAADYLVQV